MASTNVEIIESTMKNCSLSSDDQSPQMLPPPEQTMDEVPVPVPEAPDQNTGEVPVEPKARLLPSWSEYNDLRSGQKYYIKWDKNIRTNVDPRISEAEAEKAGYYLTDDESWSEYFDVDEIITEGDSILDNSTGDLGISLSLEPAEEGTIFLIVAGCGTCLKYYMVPNNAVDCSRCGSPLIHIPRGGSV